MKFEINGRSRVEDRLIRVGVTYQLHPLHDPVGISPGTDIMILSIYDVKRAEISKHPRFGDIRVGLFRYCAAIVAYSENSVSSARFLCVGAHRLCNQDADQQAARSSQHPPHLLVPFPERLVSIAAASLARGPSRPEHHAVLFLTKPPRYAVDI